LWAPLKVGCTLRACLDALGIDRRFVLGRIGTLRETAGNVENMLERVLLGLRLIPHKSVPHHHVS